MTRETIQLNYLNNNLQKKIHNLEKSKINLSSYKENVVQKHYKSGRVDLQDNFGAPRAKSNDFNYSIS